MVTDAREVQSGTRLQTDVCVVGAGPAGITLALELADLGALTPPREAALVVVGVVLGVSGAPGRIDLGRRLVVQADETVALALHRIW